MKSITKDLKRNHSYNRQSGIKTLTSDRHGSSVYSKLSVGPTGSINPFIDHQLLTTAFTDIIFQDVPELIHVVLELESTFHKSTAPYNALQFIPTLKKFDLQDKGLKIRKVENAINRHVLINNHLLKVVLINWNPGDMSSVHGHPAGGCVFKVLSGKLEEKRYSPDTEQRLLAKSKYEAGSMAYIDDVMAYHAVGNPYPGPAISIHAYTPGTV